MRRSSSLREEIHGRGIRLFFKAMLFVKDLGGVLANERDLVKRGIARFKLFQKLSTLFPMGVIAPRPVTTTLLLIQSYPFSSNSWVSLHRHTAVYTDYLAGNILCML